MLFHAWFTLALIALAWSVALERGVSRDSLEVARSVVAKHLLPRLITREVLQHYVRKALRVGAWSRLRRESRALLIAARSLPVVKSPVLKGILREIFLEIELHTLRGRAVFYGVLVALRQGLLHALRDCKRLITLGVGYLNLPLAWRVLG
jgi:predicted nucleic acid-binding protein